MPTLGRCAARSLAVTPVIFALAALSAGSASACGPDTDCVVEGGAYRVAVPEGWDGRSPLPAAIYFHGYGASAATVMRNEALVGAFADNGILLIVPDGRDKTWSHVGSPSNDRDEIAFTEAVRADAIARWPVDEDLFWVTGFSQGGSMAWDVACYRGDRFAAFVPVAGAFWEPQVQSCPTPSVNMRHIHGTGDTVVPMTGRPIGDSWHQGDVQEAVTLWRRQAECAPQPDRVVDDQGLQCREWLSCDSGRQVALCLHDGGHIMPSGWVDGAWTWVRSLQG